MRELAGRLAALDPEAGAAVRVIAYFDRLVDGHAGLEALVRGAATLAGCAARLEAPGRRIRVSADGRRSDLDTPVDPAWPGVDGLWLERPGPPSAVDAMVLERADAAIRLVLERDRVPEPVEVVLDGTASPQAREKAARRLGLGATARAIAYADGTAGVMITPPAGARAGIGPAVPVLDLPSSLAAARTAVRFTAEGTPDDPGPRVVRADELGGLVVLAEAVRPGSEPVPDVRALERAAASAPWMLATLDAVATSSSLRAAAAALTVHHSTLQDRLAHAETLLGWSVHDPSGRLRLQVALALRRLHRQSTTA
ncbi:helix-turn-helix domain-containing protein [Amycolatopsis methanolica]|uniref:CdaR family transcriptional regulator n=2 Tax=Amycolatopsis methanolica TaxID=1814 RepID=A0A076MMT8_AMYME|nr:helix-turn-helix domain-containing protein [Amycolatopsis methanolica]AIJ22004.1 CdaR family transcriptional regulator [Amycolatopsis methanolica 239]